MVLNCCMSKWFKEGKMHYKYMNIKKTILSAVLITLAYLGQSQYISNVTVPDRSNPKVVDNKDMAYRLASGISAANLKTYMHILASDSLEGRETGTNGSNLASNYISDFLKNLGVEGQKNIGDYLQPVSFTFSKWMDTDMYVNGERYRLLWDYIALPENNENHEIIRDKDVIFMGYGIDDPKYSDYKNVNVKDKIIMINRGEPWNGKKGVSYITGTTEASDWSTDLDKKLKVAKEKGVKLVLIIDEDFKKTAEDNRRNLIMPNLQLGNKKDQKLTIANSAFITTTIAKAIIGQNEKKIIKARGKIAKGKPANVVLTSDFIINMAKNVTVLSDNNVVGFVRGKTYPDEYVIISAHYDHLGKRGEEIFNGADDNASGSSVLMELARVFHQARFEGARPDRSVVFLWFTGEEKGLLGSKYYVENPIYPLEQTVADINIDMVGRVDEKYKNNPGYIYVIGSDRISSELHKINETLNDKYTQLTLDYMYNAEEDPNKFYYRSDHYNFAEKGVPAIFFFNGIHNDYHRPSDTLEKINYDEMVNRAKLIFHLAWDLTTRPDRIKADVNQNK